MILNLSEKSLVDFSGFGRFSILLAILAIKFVVNMPKGFKYSLKPVFQHF